MARNKIDRTGEVAYNNNGEKMTIVRYGNVRDIDIQFDDGTIVEHKAYCSFKNGLIKNPYFPSVYGVGYIGVGEFKTCDENGKNTKCYWTWKNMMKRCYDHKYHEKKPTYIGCSVCESWKNFQNFAKWFYENYYEFGNDKRMELDKDILNKGNKVYSPETCIFTPNFINALFTKRDNERGKYPIGVYKHKHKHTFKFKAMFSKGTGKPICLGSYDTPRLAFLVYKQAKEEYIQQIAEEYKLQLPHKLYEALMNYEVEMDD